MFKFINKSSCIAGVITTLKLCGMEVKDARSLVRIHPEFFDSAIDITKGVNNQHRNIIVTISYLHFIADKYPTYPSYECKRYAYEALKYQLKSNSNWKIIASTLSNTMHFLNGVNLMTDEEIERDLHPSKLEFDLSLH